MTRYLLDTSVAVPLRDDDPVVTRSVGALGNDVAISIVTRVELEGGVTREPAYSAIRRARLEEFLDGTSVLTFGPNEAAAYGRIIAATGYSRRKLLDRMIAAQALVADATVVTLNGDDFRDVPGLQLLEL